MAGSPSAPAEDPPTTSPRDARAPRDPNCASGFLNIRVANIGAIYEQWSARGAKVLTPPIDRGIEIRCYMRDPDGHLIEVG